MSSDYARAVAARKNIQQSLKDARGQEQKLKAAADRDPYSYNLMSGWRQAQTRVAQMERDLLAADRALASQAPAGSMGTRVQMFSSDFHRGRGS
jgi:hypothetical protein